MNALQLLADALDAAGLRGLGTGVLNESRELAALKSRALCRLAVHNDNGAADG